MKCSFSISRPKSWSPFPRVSRSFLAFSYWNSAIKLSNLIKAASLAQKSLPSRVTWITWIEFDPNWMGSMKWNRFSWQQTSSFSFIPMLGMWKRTKSPAFLHSFTNPLLSTFLVFQSYKSQCIHFETLTRTLELGLSPASCILVNDFGPKGTRDFMNLCHRTCKCIVLTEPFWKCLIHPHKFSRFLTLGRHCS